MTIIKKFETQEKKSSKKYIFLSTLLLIMLVVAEIWANNTLVNFGEKFSEISRLQQQLQLENNLIENDLATSSSLLSIASQSALLGFTKPKAVQYIRSAN